MRKLIFIALIALISCDKEEELNECSSNFGIIVVEGIEIPVPYLLCDDCDNVITRIECTTPEVCRISGTGWTIDLKHAFAQGYGIGDCVDDTVGFELGL